MATALSVFSICPAIFKQEEKLVALTGWKFRLLTLGLWIRQVTVDPAQAEVIVRRRALWVFTRRRRIRFDRIAAVTYGYRDESLWSILSSKHDTIDAFSVGLRLHNDDEVHLFTFFGDGTFQNNGVWPDWMYWPRYAFDVSGTQDSESRTFVDLLSKMIGVEVVPPRG